MDAAMLLLQNSGRQAEALRQEVGLLWELTAGNVWSTQTDADAASGKAVPSGAVAAEISSIGGKTTEQSGEQVSAAVVRVESLGKNRYDQASAFSDTTKFTIEDGVITGTATNFLGVLVRVPADLAGKTLTFSAWMKTETTTNLRVSCQKDGAILSDGNYVNSTTQFARSAVTFTAQDGVLVNIRYGSSAGTIYVKDVQLEVSEAATDFEPYGAVDTLEIPAAVRALEGYGQSEIGGDGNVLDLADGTYTEIGHYVDGAWTPLDEPEVTDVSALLPDNMLEVRPGGTLVFVQKDGTELEVPSTVDYLIKLSEVTP